MSKMTKEERSWVLYDWANSAYTIIVTTAIFPIFFKSTAAAGWDSGAQTAALGFVNSTASILVAFLAPILGAIADYLGRKKKLFLFFFLTGVMATGGLYFIQSGYWLGALILYAASAVGFSGSTIFYDSFLTDVTSRERMDYISAKGFSLGYIGSTIPFVLCLAFIMLADSLGLDKLWITQLSFVVTALWWAAFTIPMILNVKQKHGIEPEKAFISGSFKRIIETFKNLKNYKAAFMFLLAYFFYIDGVQTIIKMANPIAIDAGIPSDVILIVLFALQLIAFPATMIYQRLSRKYSARAMILTAIITYVVVTLVAFFIPWFQDIGLRIVLFCMLGFLVGTAQGGIQALSRSMFGKLIPADRSGEFFGFYNILGRFAAIVGPALVAVFTLMTGASTSGMLSLNLLFVIGGILLFKVKDTSLDANS